MASMNNVPPSIPYLLKLKEKYEEESLKALSYDKFECYDMMIKDIDELIKILKKGK